MALIVFLIMLMLSLGFIFICDYGIAWLIGKGILLLFGVEPDIVGIMYLVVALQLISTVFFSGGGSAND